MFALLKAFHLEFTPNEPVSLLIKSDAGSSPSEAARIIRAATQDVKESLRLYPSLKDYHNEIIITQWLTTEEVMRIHKTGDCFVLPSYGEGWGIPGFEAMALGNPVILTDEGGPADYVEHGESGLLTPCTLEPVFMRPEEATLSDIWVSNEDWCAVDINALRSQMRMVYENKELRQKLSSGGIDRAYDFSYSKVGTLMKEFLDGTRSPILSDRARTLREKHCCTGLAKI